MSHYDVLGVKSSASAAEISEAHRFLARQFHPDQHPGAGDEERARFDKAMARVNEAYNSLKDPERRRQYDLLQVDEAAGEDRWRPPALDECTLCGHTPAVAVLFEHQQASIFRATRYTSGGYMCRSCALSVGRAKQNRTLWTGWWGFPAVVTNLAVIFRNAQRLHDASTLPAPSTRFDTAWTVVPLERPMDAGKAIWARGGMYAAVLFWIVGVGIGVGASQSQKYDTPAGGYTNPSVAVWRVGACVKEVGSSVHPVMCGESMDGIVMDQVSYPWACPPSTYAYVDDGASGYYCIGR